ncbi:hypothetical protein N0V83_009700 [Neocucurbitaria cava]|uniref:Peptidase A1 domain-containing protein n=1 Tax=Neocucurbitaria cava TaxID=798079 RepID=A0A9W8XZR5_9PLEO|nr:hypothetical protein N0V83_009700 [Neocucurbitaria cava]
MLWNTLLLFLTPALARTRLPARDTDPNDLSIYKQAIYLPFTKDFSSDYTPTVRGSINGRSFTFPVDTGSTGLMIGAPLLPDVDLSGSNADQYEQGWEFLTSSSLLYNGRFVPLDVTFYGSSRKYTAVSKVLVLVVQSVIKCPAYNSTTGQGICPDGGSVQSTASPKHVTYMGVGFGRNVAGSGLNFGSSDHNPFLNIVNINGRSTYSFRTGYVVSTTGVHLGLTTRNTRDAVWVDLDYGATDDWRDWAMVDMAMRVNEGQDEYAGKALVDTGIPQMFIQPPPGVKLPTVRILNPATNPTTKYTSRITNGTYLDFAFPSFQDGVAGYDFEVGDESFPSQPAYVQPVAGRPSTYFNSGRNFLFGFTIIFDADGGRFGLICLKCNDDEGYYGSGTD